MSEKAHAAGTEWSRIPLAGSRRTAVLRCLVQETNTAVLKHNRNSDARRSLNAGQPLSWSATQSGSQRPWTGFKTQLVSKAKPVATYKHVARSSYKQQIRSKQEICCNRHLSVLTSVASMIGCLLLRLHVSAGTVASHGASVFTHLPERKIRSEQADEVSVGGWKIKDSAAGRCFESINSFS